jgi:hypothetical protein
MRSNCFKFKTRIREMAIIIAGLTMLNTQTQASSGVPSWAGPSFRATQTEYNVKAPEESRSATVYMSKYGVKMVSGGLDGSRDSSAGSTIFIAVKDEAYLIIPERKMYIDPSNSEGAIVKDDDATGIFATKPCEHFKHAESIGLVKLKDRDTEKWRCSNQPGASDVIHYMDKNLKCVIRSETGDGTVTELSDITLENHPKEFFEIPKGYRKGTLRELFQNPSALPPYESAAPSPIAPN